MKRTSGAYPANEERGDRLKVLFRRQLPTLIQTSPPRSPGSPAHHTQRQQRDRAGTRVESKHPYSLAQSAKTSSFLCSLPASAGAGPRSQPRRHPPRAPASASHPQVICWNAPFCVNRRDPEAVRLTRCSSGNGSERALMAVTPIPRAPRESSILPRVSLRVLARSRGAKKIQRSGIGPERALEAIKPSLAPRAKAPSFPELPCERRPGPAEPKNTAERDRAGASIGSDQTLPRAPRESSILSRASLRALARSRGALATTTTD